MSALAKLMEMPLSRVLILAAVVSGLYYLLIFDNGSKWKAQTATALQRKSEIETETVTVDKEIQEINNLKAAQERDAEKLNTLFAYIPEKLTKVEIMRTISTEAKAVGANINSIRDSAGGSSGQNQKSEFYEEMAVEVDLAGTFPQLLLFLSNLTRINQIMSVENLTLNVVQGATSENMALSMAAMIKAYRYIGKEAKEKPK